MKKYLKFWYVFIIAFVMISAAVLCFCHKGIFAIAIGIGNIILCCDYVYTTYKNIIKYKS